MEQNIFRDLMIIVCLHQQLLIRQASSSKNVITHCTKHEVLSRLGLSGIIIIGTWARLRAQHLFRNMILSVHAREVNLSGIYRS